MLPCLSIQERDESAKARQCELACEVLKQFEGKFPGVRLLIFLDDEDWYDLKANGSENRGAFIPINEYNYGKFLWPDDLREEIAKVDPDTSQFSLLVDAVVYLHGDTCKGDAALTTTLAHELQHFVQYHLYRDTWAWCFVLFKCGGLVDAENLSWQHIPTEHEARFIAKRVSLAVLGSQRTDQYIEFRHTHALKPRDKADWEFIKTIDTTVPYDVISETQAIFRKYGNVPAYRNEMESVLAKAKSMPECKHLTLDDLLGNGMCIRDFKLPKPQRLLQRQARDCGVVVFAEMAGVSYEDVLNDLPGADLSPISVDAWENWIKSKGFAVQREQGCPQGLVPCAHLVSTVDDNRFCHWVYRDDDGDVHDPSPRSIHFAADDPRMRNLSLYDFHVLTVSVTRSTS
jgi:hypothetical protein